MADLYSQPTGNLLNPSNSTIVSFLNSNAGTDSSDPTAIIGNLSKSLDLTTSLGILDPGEQISLHASVSASAYIAENSAFDLSKSTKADGSPVALKITVTGGSNTIDLNKGPSLIASTSGNDTIKSAGGRDSMYGGTGRDSMIGGGRSLMVGGVSGGDTLVGGLKASARDTIVAHASSHVRVSLGHDVITAGTKDTIDAGQSQSVINTARGPVTVTGGNGANIFGSGHSSIVGGGNNNTINLSGQDKLVAGGGANTVNIADGSQASIQGGAGLLNVNMSSTSGTDTLFGGSGGLTIHVSAAMGTIVGDTGTLDGVGAHIVQFSGGATLHVTNVNFEFTDGTKRPV